MESWASPERSRVQSRWRDRRLPGPAVPALVVPPNPVGSRTHLRGLLLALLASGLIHVMVLTVLGPVLPDHYLPQLPAPLTLQIILKRVQAPIPLAAAPSRQAPQSQKSGSVVPTPVTPAPVRSPRVASAQRLPAPRGQSALRESVVSGSQVPVATQPVMPTQPVVSASGSAAPALDEPVSEARADADYLRNPPPIYPDFARSRGWVGRVLLKVHVLASGRPDQIELQQSCGHKRLDDAARHAVQEWAFVPAKRGNSAIDSWVSVPIDFKLAQ